MKRKGNYKRTDQAVIDKIQELEKQGLTKKAIAEQLSLSISVVSKYTAPTKKYLTLAEKKQVRKLYDEGLSIEAIADKTGRNASTIQRITKSFPTRKRPYQYKNAKPKKMRVLKKPRRNPTSESKRKPDNTKEPEVKLFPNLDPISGRVKLRIDNRTEIWVKPERMEAVKEKYGL